DLRPVPGGANIVHLSVRRSLSAAGPLEAEQVVFLADAVDIEAAESVFALHGAVEVIDAVAPATLDRGEDDLDLVAGRDDVAALGIVLQRAAGPLPDLPVLVDDEHARVIALACLPLEPPLAAEILRERRRGNRSESRERDREKAY